MTSRINRVLFESTISEYNAKTIILSELHNSSIQLNINNYIKKNIVKLYYYLATRNTEQLNIPHRLIKLLKSISTV